MATKGIQKKKKKPIYYFSTKKKLYIIKKKKKSVHRKRLELEIFLYTENDLST